MLASRLAESTAELTLDIERVLGVSARQPVRATFRFDPDHPLIVTAELLVEGGPRVLWRIGRDLLTQGLHSMSGLGDVQIWPSCLHRRTTARLRLTSGDMAALFELPLPPLAQWLEHTYQAVTTEHALAAIDWDLATTDLLQHPAPGTDTDPD
ncbi:SsgA family sporulation/cell division regulator [Streptomyces sp. V4-01]|uniref:SsgA family sporulation/cell division regulator n=1 Tax=Actinacidiphila polyblastidii TaxID=3110430 RepID=A0ABU7PBB1_9ACTN|nr:SsgA family sporulation/cell division regulator [Streptomyces sp. V4-01]